jgi:glycine cleavage system H protein
MGAPDREAATLEVRGCRFPAHLHYHVEHNLWVARDAEGIATVGATGYAALLAREVLSFFGKRPGIDIRRDRGLGVIELSKVVQSVPAPISGRVVGVNAAAEAQPALIVRDPYGAGWLIRIAPSDWVAESSALVTGAAVADAFERRMALDGFEGPEAAQP